MNLLSTVRDWFAPKSEQRSFPAISLEDWIEFFQFDGNLYQTWGGLEDEEAASDLEGVTRHIYARNGVVAACLFLRMAVFSEARFRYRRFSDGRPGELFGTPMLRRLERPWPRSHTGDLLTRMITDADLAGNSFTALRSGPRLKRMRPDWTFVVMGLPEEVSPEEVEALDPIDDLDAEVIGYGYVPGGMRSGRTPQSLLPEEVAHFAPIPDPTSPWRGISWLEPVMRELRADNLATEHKAKFFKNAATPNLVVKLDIADVDNFKTWVETFENEHKGVANAYKTLFFGAGAETTVVGNSFREMDFRNLTGGAENRIAMAAGVPPTILGTSEGLQGSSLNAGNYGQARRRFADITMRPLWRSAAGALEHLAPPPEGAELWYDPSDIPFLQEDQLDDAEIRNKNANTISQLVSIGGFTPESTVDAVVSGDLNRLEHSGLVPVQQHPQETDDADDV